MIGEVGPNHKSGFVNIIGKPNVGKSTLMNALVGDKLSIITSKAQTTRHRIFGIVNGDDFQIVFSDTPGIIKPNYKMQESMMGFVRTSLEDADVFLYMIDPKDTIENQPNEFEIIQKTEIPSLLVINKIDRYSEKELQELTKKWKSSDFNFTDCLEISALNNVNVDLLMNKILNLLPNGPAYYPKDALTDKPERFFVTEIIREKIFRNYKQEVPYSCEVVVEEFKEDEELIRIRAEIYVNRKTQKPIIIGKNASKIKQVSIEARADIEQFFGKKVFMEIYVRVKENWRDDDRMLRSLGYKE